MTTSRRSGRRTWHPAALATVTALALVAPPAPAQAASYASDQDKPDLTTLLVGYGELWRSTSAKKLKGKVRDASQLAWNDRMASWINQHATPAQQFRALQDAEYLNADRSGYDQSLTISDSLGKRLGKLYVQGRINGKLPLTSKLLNTADGLVGDYLTTGSAKTKFSYPRPFLPTKSSTKPVSGDSSSCAPSAINATSLAKVRKGKSWTDSKGNLEITRVPAAVDTTKAFATTNVRLDAGYGGSLCTSGSFPSGHTRAAYAVGLTLATLLPELAPSILARASEAANNRIVLGVHYPLDVIGGRIAGQAAVAARWSDKSFRDKVLTPTRKELVNYLESACGATLAKCMANDDAYRNNPYNGAEPPRGSSQVVAGRATALAVYTERLGYGFTATQKRGRAASVPSGAENLLRTAFPTLTSAQRTQVLAQTEIDSGHALDTTELHRKKKGPGSWQRLNLAAAMSASVKVSTKGKVTVISVGGAPTVVKG
ncbi:MAG: phosphatase PAP2 family protein [Micropruina sp.]|uniref:phosphatase PAP2 family protein n=1 Tax=Micropruina sp. TaxID=2737536 RepID=UPI0039E3A4A9